MDMFWSNHINVFSGKNLVRKIFNSMFSAKNLVQICLALRERVSLIRIYNGTYGINSFTYLQHVMCGINSCAYLQHVMHKNIINVKEKVLYNIFYIII